MESLACKLQNPYGQVNKYDGDGRRVSQTINGVTTYFVGNYYIIPVGGEVTGAVVTKYYYAGSQRVAMRVKDGIADNVYFLLGDHLGSTSLTTNASGNVVSEMRYTPWGEVRYNAGTTPTDYTYTGQYSNTADFGLMFYNARWYDPYLNHFTQPDSIVPDPYNSQDYDRYAYARYNPVTYTDPSGHEPKWEGSCYESNNGVCFDTAGNLIQYGVIFKPESDYEGVDSDINSFVTAITKEAQRMFDVYCSPQLAVDCGYDTPAELYLATHDDTVITLSNSSLDKYCQRQDDTSNVICGSNSRGKITPIIAAHEMGHVFNFIIRDNGNPLDDPYHDLANERANNPLFPALDVAIATDYASNGRANGEDFANMYSMWVDDVWVDTQRKEFMNDNMYIWIQQMLD